MAIFLLLLHRRHLILNMPLEPLILAKAIAASLSKLFKALVSARADLRRLRSSDQADLQKTIPEGIKRCPDRSALGSYLRCRKEREIIRAMLGLTLSPKEVPAFYAYMEEDHASERDLRLAWPHRALSPEGTFDFVLKPADQRHWLSCRMQASLYILCAGCAWWMARLTPPSELLQIAKIIALALFMTSCSAAPMYACRSIRAAKRIQHRRGDNR